MTPTTLQEGLTLPSLDGEVSSSKEFLKNLLTLQMTPEVSSQRTIVSCFKKPEPKSSSTALSRDPDPWCLSITILYEATGQDDMGSPGFCEPSVVHHGLHSHQAWLKTLPHFLSTPK